MTSQDLDEQLAEFNVAFDQGGLYGALHYLNERISYRYTAIYRLDGNMMRNIFLYDRKGENPTTMAPMPLGNTLCQFALADNGFNTSNSVEDERLAGHPARGIINSYFGLPLFIEPGRVYGTLCHFDFDPKVIPDSEVPLLKAVSGVLIDFLE
ncbi:MAG: guanylate cyclase [Polaromonas sp.]|nr:guanylate cyclase [Polaromonas sp.]